MDLHGARVNDPVPDAPVSKAMLLELYRQMLLIRRVEEQAAKAYTMKKIKGFCHLYIGQEAVAVGACAALEADDYVVAAYRDHGQIMARGADPKAVMAELFGKASGTTRGIGGSMHLVSREHNFWGGYGIVGGQVPLGAGAAFAARYLANGRVSLTFFGEGAAQQGAFYEALELSQLWSLPAVFLCENNYYAMGTSLDRQSYEKDMSRRGEGLGMKHWQFEAFDVVDVYRNVKAAVDHARAGNGPVLLEAITYRYQGHSMSDPAKYRSKDEVDEHRKTTDGLKLVEQRLASEHGVDDDALQPLQEEAKAIAKEAYAFAEAAPDPDPADLYAYTYATGAK
ncbi:MAG: pyruvate dehydrogenase (acetyl-transferring) E1 component subunit alpha [Alphaproteobacteria bacterium]|nr:pyruvate dehydrogenase (acetyl-transferring) E1 component subunit alpha [Alphaproteobacteria bacterium]